MQEGEIVIAESQEKGRGRLGRHWFSPPFLNLYLSVILRPKIPPSSGLPDHPHGGCGHGRSDRTLFRPSSRRSNGPMIILLKNRKVAGLLNEIHSETDRIHFVILGIGVNLNMEKRTSSERDPGMATSLKMEMGKTVSRKEFVLHASGSAGKMVRPFS